MQYIEIFTTPIGYYIIYSLFTRSPYGAAAQKNESQVIYCFPTNLISPHDSEMEMTSYHTELPFVALSFVTSFSRYFTSCVIYSRW